MHYSGDISQDDDDDDGEDDDDDDDVDEDWIEAERKDFLEFKDKNKDGHLDASEVEQWILPESSSYVTSEVEHLLAEADENKVCLCTNLCSVVHMPH